MSNQIVILSSVTQPDGSFSVSGVFWLTAPSNAVVPNPAFSSQNPNIDATTLISLQTGSLVEQPFTTGLFASGTNLASVQSSLTTQYSAAQTALNATNPPLANLIGTVYSGAAWSTPSPTSFFLRVPPVVEMDWAIAMGVVQGVTAGRPTGYTATSATSGKAIRATTYTPQGANAQRSVSSTDVNDTSAGSGARTVLITYLNTSFVLKTETVTMNGTTPVNTIATDIAFIESMQVSTVGTQGGGNAGTVQLWTGTAGGGSVWSSIAASDNITYYAHHYIPSGVTCYLLNLHGGATAVAGAITVNRSGNPLTTTAPQVGVSGTFNYIAGGSEDHNYRVPIAIPGPDLIWLVTRPNAVTASTSYGTFEYVQF
jgi:hypothetical protein